jgi:hypothetical protein
VGVPGEPNCRVPEPFTGDPGIGSDGADRRWRVAALDTVGLMELDCRFSLRLEAKVPNCTEVLPMRRLLLGSMIAFCAGLDLCPADSALAQCEGTSGSATINDAPWMATCVIAFADSHCVGCYEVLGINDVDPTYTSVALFLSEPLVEGRTYALGGTLPNNPNGAVVLGEGAYAITDQPPYVGEATLDVYNPGTGAIDWTFHFLAMGIFTYPDVNVTSGHFAGTLLPVQPATWSGVKSLYRH